MAKPLPIDKPTRSGILQLLESLRHYPDYRHSEFHHLDEELDRLRNKLLNVKKYKDLEERKDKARAEWDTAHTVLQVEVRRVRNLFLSKGLTPAIQKELDELVEFANNRRGLIDGTRRKVRKDHRRTQGTR